MAMFQISSNILCTLYSGRQVLLRAIIHQINGLLCWVQVLTLMMQPEKVVDARKMIEQIWPSARLLHSQGGLLKFKLDAKIKASDVFSVMQDIMPEEVSNNP